MTVREYIGARYVPLFIGEWNSENAYEPLSVVSYQGNSYTSRQAVPVGIPITNETYWVVSGNYNAQVEAYRQEVRTFDSRITANANAIEQERNARKDDFNAAEDDIEAEKTARQNADTALQNAITAEETARQNADNELAEKINELEENITFNESLEIHMFDGVNPGNYTATLVKAKDKAVLIDTAVDSGLITFINNLNVTHLDALIITHFHIDHYDTTNLARLISANLIDVDTKIYKQMEPTASNDQYNLYVTLNNELETTLQSNGLNHAIVPINESVLELDELKLTFFNTNTSFKTIYDNQSWANRSIPNSTPTDFAQRRTSLNNYSLIVRFDYRCSSYLELGDLEGMGQKLNLEYIQPVDVCKVPHHAANKMGVENFFEKINPNFWILSNHFLETDVENRTDLGAWILSYIYRYLVYKSIQTPIITNINNNVEIKILYGNVIKAEGHILDKDYNPDDTLAPTMQFGSILPPDIYYENPYYIFTNDFTIQELLRVFKNYDSANMPVSWRIPTSGIFSKTEFSIKIRELFEPFDVSTRVIYLSHDEYMHPTVSFASVENPYQTIVIYEANGNDVTLKSFSNVSLGDPQIILNFGENGLKTGDNISDYDPNNYWSNMRLSNILECQVASGTLVTLVRKMGYPKTNTNQRSSFEGFAFNTNATYIYSIYIDANSVVKARRINIADGTVDETANIVNIMSLRRIL